MHVQNLVAVVRHETFAEHRAAAQRFKRTGHLGAGQRNYLNRQREAPQLGHQLAVVDDADKDFAGRGHDFLAGQRAATAFDQAALTGGFVGAIDINRQFAGVVEVNERNAYRPQSGGTGLGTRHCAAQSLTTFPQRVDEKVGRAAGADADDAIVRHKFERGLRHATFLFVLIHIALRDQRAAGF